jgi:hypothetical protein
MPQLDVVPARMRTLVLRVRGARVCIGHDSAIALLAARQFRMV